MLFLFVYFCEDSEIKLKFWMERDIVGEMEILVLNEIDLVRALNILEHLDELFAVGSSSASPENVMELRVEKSLIPQIKKKIYEKM